MIREIKFRAYDKKQKRIMLHFAEPDLCLEYGLLAWESVEYPGICNIPGLPSIEDLEIMQFTGLKDKNGKEIYEGDILATSNSDPQYDIWDKDENGLSVVIWEQESFGWSGSKWWVTVDEDSVYDMDFVEVVGNIHENPELLK